MIEQILPQNSTQKNSPNPLEELLAETRVVIQSLFPQATEWSLKLDFTAPPAHVRADYSFSTYELAVIVGSAPEFCAHEIVKRFQESKSLHLTSIEAVGAHINLEVNKKYFLKRAVEYICNGKGSHTEDSNPLSESGLIHCVPTRQISNLDVLRMVLVGAVVTECYKRVSREVFHTWYLPLDSEKVGFGISDFLKRANQHVLKFSEDELSSTKTAMVDTALEVGVVEHIYHTNAIVSTSIAVPPVLLVKNDGTITDFMRHLSSLKLSNSKTKLSTFIFISLQNQVDTMGSFLVHAKYFHTIAPDTECRSIFITETAHEELPSKVDESYCYAILRTPLYKEICLTSESLLQFSYLKSVVAQLKTRVEVGVLNNSAFEIIKLLIIFPKVTSDMRYAGDPSILCKYLEEVAEKSKNLKDCNVQLVQCIKIVLENGLDYLNLQKFVALEIHKSHKKSE